MTDSTRRFSDRVENYVKYRPGYPPDVIALLESACGLSDGSLVADVGSGTGILSRLFLDRGCSVFGVEPNDEMRRAAEGLLGGFPRFTSVKGTAEETGLPDGCADVVTAGQAFHWFDRGAFRSECRRILRPGGWIVLVWNDRLKDATPFLAEYEALLREFGTDYSAVDHANIGEDELRAFFSPGRLRIASFPNRQVFDFAGLEGRLLSSSYAPAKGHPRHAPMVEALRKLFDHHQEVGGVTFEYKTKVYFGKAI
jgi:SAM-dependent methyltransferase